MKAIKFLFLLSLPLFFAKANAQGVDGGTILMGGTMGFTTSSATTEANGQDLKTGSQFQFSMSPKMGYFFFDNFAAGLSINFSTASRTTESKPNKITGDSTTIKTTESETQLLAGPFFRYYYFPTEKIGIFGELEIGLGAGSVDAGSSSNSVGQFSFGIGPGLTFFANDMVAIEALAKYNMLTQTTNITGPNMANYKSTTTISKIDFGVGFQFYFNRVIGQ